MSDNKHEDPLLEWNRLNINNAEQDLVSAMFSSIISTAPIIDKFVSWLLAGAGATAALMIANINNILPFLSKEGFKVAGAFLVISGVLGLVAKIKSIQCQVAYENDIKIREKMKPILQKHEEDEDKIQAHAKERGIELETEIDINKVLIEFYKPAPKWAAWLAMRYINKHKDNRQVGYIKPMQTFYLVSSLAFMQAVSFIVFFVVAMVYARAI